VQNFLKIGSGVPELELEDPEKKRHFPLKAFIALTTVALPVTTRKLCYRKDDRAMRAI